MPAQPRRAFSRALQNLTCTLATGYILFFFSERLFWTVWKVGDSLLDLTITWLAYSVIAYLFIATVSWSRADDFWSIYLAGAIYGWLVEGGLADTLYGTQPSAPFPVSISITGLSWHTLFSVMVGWWATRRALIAPRPGRLVWISLAVGVFWGLWAMFPRSESPSIITPLPAFLANAVVLTLGLVASWWMILRSGVRSFRPGWVGLSLCTLLIGLFYVQQVLKLGIVPLLVLPILICVAAGPLYRHRQRTEHMQHGSSLGFHRSRLLILGLTPITATLTYGLAVAGGMDRIPISTIVYYYICGPAGFVLFIVAIGVVLWRSRERPDSS